MKGMHLLLCVALAGSGLYGAQRWLDGRPAAAVSAEEALYLPDPDLLRRLSFGYESLLADIYWLRTVQYFGAKDRTVAAQDYTLLEPLLRITVGLDPELILVYRYGSVFLSEPQPIGAGQPDKGLALLDQGIARNPDAWQLLFDKGFGYFWYLQDYAQAAEWFRRGSEHPESPEWMDGLAAFALERGGDLEAARYLWSRQYEESENESMRANALAHLRSLQVDQDIWTLEHRIDRFLAGNGRPPASWQEMIRAGLLPAVPVDPLGNAYELTTDGARVMLSAKSGLRRFPLPAVAKERFLERLTASEPVAGPAGAELKPARTP